MDMKFLNFELKRIEKVSTRKREISMWLDDYDEIFSDFDPRPYWDRNLSVDFLTEARMISEQLEDNVVDELRLLIPKALRNTKQEKYIRDRIMEHIESSYVLGRKKVREIYYEGAFFIMLGSILTIFLSFYLDKQETLLFLSLLLHPASWFLIWEGLHLIVFGSKEIRADYEFNSRMKGVKISFGSYNPRIQQSGIEIRQ